MARRFGQVLIHGLGRRARLVRLLRGTRLSGALLRVARLLVARFPAVAVARRAVSCTRRARCACGCVAMASLAVLRTRRAISTQRLVCTDLSYRELRYP